MEIIYAVALLGACFILAAIVYLGSRMPVTPAWANDTLVANVWCVLIVGLIAFGIGFLVQYAAHWDERTLGARELAILAVLVIGYALVWSALGVRKRLARYAAARRALADDTVRPINGGSTPPTPVPPSRRVPPKAA
ncbi:MAG: hypothetical protein R3286_02090 [Gammaproteobacteria bacterium]|nr:hypothetical protein [Gammaproteobacteria bacterium]